MESQDICHPAANLQPNFARHIPATCAAIRPDLMEAQLGSNPALELLPRFVGVSWHVRCNSASATPE